MGAVQTTCVTLVVLTSRELYKQLREKFITSFKCKQEFYYPLEIKEAIRIQKKSNLALL